MTINVDLLEFPEELFFILTNAVDITVLTGAGVSAESGIPTFREAQTGLWSTYNPQMLASPLGFRQNPALVWKWYQWRRDLILGSKPNLAHIAIAQIEGIIPNFTLITQNVDGLHQLAGSKNIIELHGNIHRTKCFNENIVIEEWKDSGDIPPHCPRCGGYLRPDVVWFGEMLSADTLYRAQNAAENCDVFFSIGTSSIVEPAASLPIIAVKSGAHLIEINISKTSISSYATYVIQGTAASILPKCEEIIFQRSN